MNEPGTQKICVVCGEVCLGRARVRDRAGRYFCEECYERVRAEARSRRAAAEGLLPPAPPPPRHLGGEDASPDVIEISIEEVVREAPPPPPDRERPTCPMCSGWMSPDAQICTFCGYEVSTGTKLAPEIDDEGLPPTDTIWPQVMGFGSVIVALFTLMMYLAGLAGGTGAIEAVISSNLIGVREAVHLIGQIMPIALMLWLAVSGLGVLRRQRWGARALHAWAVAKCAFTLILFTLMVIGLGLRDAEQLALARSLAAAVIGALAIMVWQLIWPLITIFWLAKPEIREETIRWL